MKVDIRFVHTNTNGELSDQVNDKLSRLHLKYDWIISAMVFLKEEKGDQGKDFQCEIRLSVPGPQLFAESYEENFGKAINKTIDELGVQLEKKKDKMQAKR